MVSSLFLYSLTAAEVMALYKEVQGYFDTGLEVPDDVTLLFSDDNFGTVRRLPTSKEMIRRGRAGVGSHSFVRARLTVLGILSP